MEWTLSQEPVSPRLAWLCPSPPLLPPACRAPSSGLLLQHGQPTLVPCSQPHQCACGYDRAAGIFSVPGPVLHASHTQSWLISQQPVKNVLGWPFFTGEDSEAQGESGTCPESRGDAGRKSDCKTDLSPPCSSVSQAELKPEKLSPPGVVANRLHGLALSDSIAQNKTIPSI